MFNEQYDEEQYAMHWALENQVILFSVSFFQSYRDFFLRI